jgi:hypothetical protein
LRWIFDMSPINWFIFIYHPLRWNARISLCSECFDLWPSASAKKSLSSYACALLMMDTSSYTQQHKRTPPMAPRRNIFFILRWREKFTHQSNFSQLSSLSVCVYLPYFNSQTGWNNGTCRISVALSHQVVQSKWHPYYYCHNPPSIIPPCIEWNAMCGQRHT